MGGMGAITTAMAAVQGKGRGAENVAAVRQIVVRDGRAQAVLLEDGTENSARASRVERGSESARSSDSWHPKNSIRSFWQTVAASR